MMGVNSAMKVSYFKFKILVRSSAQNERNCKFMYSKDYYTYTPNTKSATSTKNGHPVIT